MTERISARAILGTVFMILVVWISFAFFSSSEFYRRTVATERREAWSAVLRFQLSSSLIWATFTPFVIFIAERLPLRKPHRLRNAALLLPIAAVLSVVRAAGGGAIGQWAEGSRIPFEFLRYSVEVRFHRNLFLILVIIGVTNLILAQRNVAEHERVALGLKASLADAEIQRFRATMQPAYLFSTIAGIAANVRERANVADRMLVDLSGLLRAANEFASRDTVTLADELELIDRYFDIEKARTGGAISTRVLVDEELLAARVPASILRLLVESACIANGRDQDRIEIRGRAENGTLVLELLQSAAGTGHESVVAEIRSRLGRSVTGPGSVDFRREEGLYVTEIRLPLELPVEAKAS